MSRSSRYVAQCLYAPRLSGSHSGLCPVEVTLTPQGNALAKSATVESKWMSIKTKIIILLTSKKLKTTCLIRMGGSVPSDAAMRFD